MRTAPEASATGLLLPERRRLAGDASPAFARLMARAQRFECAPGEQAQLARWFTPAGDGWPVAALQRQAESGDAGGFLWMRADPVHVRAEMGGARLMAWDTLGLAADEADALVEAIAPAFAEHGIDVGRTRPDAWYLRLQPGATLPDATAAPGDALGEDIAAHLPGGEAGRAWRRMQSDAQILLTQHPVNQARSTRGMPTANSLWFWGEGVLPASVSAAFAAGVVATRDPQLAALAGASGRAVVADDHGQAGLVDLRRARQWLQVEEALAARLPDGLRTGLVLDFADAPRLLLRPRPWWRPWS